MNFRKITAYSVLALILALGGLWAFHQAQAWYFNRQVGQILDKWDIDPVIQREPMEFVTVLNQRIANTDNRRTKKFHTLVRGMEKLLDETDYYSVFQDEEEHEWAKDNQEELNRFREDMLALKDLPKGVGLRKELQSPILVSYHRSSLFEQKRAAVRVLLTGARTSLLAEGNPEEADLFFKAAVFVARDLAPPMDSFDLLTADTLENMIWHSLLKNFPEFTAGGIDLHARRLLPSETGSPRALEDQFFYEGLLLEFAFIKDAQGSLLPEEFEAYQDQITLLTTRKLGQLSRRDTAREKLTLARDYYSDAKVHQAPWKDKLEKASEGPQTNYAQLKLSLETVRRLLLSSFKLLSFHEEKGEFPQSLNRLFENSNDPSWWATHPETDELLSYHGNDREFTLSAEMSFDRPANDIPLSVTIEK